MSNEGTVAERSQVRAEQQERKPSASAVTSLKCADVFLTVHYFSTHTLSRFILIFHVLLETLLIEFCCQLIPSLFVKKKKKKGLTCLPPAAEVDDSQDSSIMTDADDTQLHTAESDDVL